MTRINKTQAAKSVGISRQHFYNHIKSKKISVVRGEDGNEYIDESEMRRVYGDQYRPDRMTSNETTSDDSIRRQGDTRDDSAEKDAHAQSAIVDVLRESAKSERSLLEEHIASLEKALERAQDGQSKLTLLLENHSKESDNKWEVAIRDLEKRISDQDRVLSERDEREKLLLRRTRRLQEELNAERSRGLFDRLFGAR